MFPVSLRSFHACCFLACQYGWLVSAESSSLTDNRDYETGRLGMYPLRAFESSDIVAPRMNIVREDSRCARNMKTFLSPRIVTDPSSESRAIIVDRHGQLVWSSGWEGKDVHNLMVQDFQGSKHITFWAGKTEGHRSHGGGTFYMLDETYSLRRRIHAANGLMADFHEFRITPQNTAILTAYDTQDYDTSNFGGPARSILDCVVQEVDIETGELKFEWRASKHVSVTQTEHAFHPDSEAPFDWFHVNSVDKDANGNFLIASKYMNSLFYVNGTTEDVIWTLGGKGSVFRDLSNGEASSFRSPQDARINADGTEITVFDAGHPTWLNRGGPRGLKLRVEPAKMTVKIVSEYRLPDREVMGDGSMQVLPNGNVFIGYGSSGVYAEFSSRGELLCESQFAPQMSSGASLATSYRVLKFDWHAYPETTPNLVLSRGSGIWKAYASWHGATELSSWRLEGADGEGTWRRLDKAKSAGFETEIALNSPNNFVRVVALNRKGRVLGTSEPVDARMVDIVSAPLS